MLVNPSSKIWILREEVCCESAFTAGTAMKLLAYQRKLVKIFKWEHCECTLSLTPVAKHELWHVYIFNTTVIDYIFRTGGIGVVKVWKSQKQYRIFIVSLCLEFKSAPSLQSLSRRVFPDTVSLPSVLLQNLIQLQRSIGIIRQTPSILKLTDRWSEITWIIALRCSFLWENFILWVLLWQEPPI